MDTYEEILSNLKKGILKLQEELKTNEKKYQENEMLIEEYKLLIEENKNKLRKIFNNLTDKEVGFKQLIISTIKYLLIMSIIVMIFTYFKDIIYFTGIIEVITFCESVLATALYIENPIKEYFQTKNINKDEIYSEIQNLLNENQSFATKQALLIEEQNELIKKNDILTKKINSKNSTVVFLISEIKRLNELSLEQNQTPVLEKTRKLTKEKNN